jgi:hypothetical protein
MILSERFYVGGTAHYFLAIYDEYESAVTVQTWPHGKMWLDRTFKIPHEPPRDFISQAVEIAWAERDKYEKALKQEAWTKAHPSSYSDMPFRALDMIPKAP